MKTKLAINTEGHDEWLTPPEIIRSLGVFDLDPCAPINRPWDMAINHFTIKDNGLSKKWSGRIWLNPPYGNEAIGWLSRIAEHGNGILLIFARTETKMFFKYVWDKADAVLFLKGRIRFFYVDGTISNFSGGAPSCLVAYGEENVTALINSGIKGQLVFLNHEVAETKQLRIDNIIISK